MLTAYQVERGVGRIEREKCNGGEATECFAGRDGL